MPYPVRLSARASSVLSLQSDQQAKDSPDFKGNKLLRKRQQLDSNKHSLSL